MTAPDNSSFAAVMLKLTEFAARLAALENSRGSSAKNDEPETYEIQPSIHWWSVTAEQHGKAIDHLKAWVEQVYRPHYGHLAVVLGACWQEHPLCLLQLDWLSELHSYLYFSERTQAILVAQAEYGTRIVPAVSEQLRIETSKCNHRKETADGNSWRNDSGRKR